MVYTSVGGQRREIHVNRKERWWGRAAAGDRRVRWISTTRIPPDRRGVHETDVECFIWLDAPASCSDYTLYGQDGKLCIKGPTGSAQYFLNARNHDVRQKEALLYLSSKCNGTAFHSDILATFQWFLSRF